MNPDDRAQLILDLWKAALEECPGYSAELTLYGLAAAELQRLDNIISDYGRVAVAQGFDK